jgi:hypothetical protein
MILVSSALAANPNVANPRHKQRQTANFMDSVSL